NWRVSSTSPTELGWGTLDLRQWCSLGMELQRAERAGRDDPRGRVILGKRRTASAVPESYHATGARPAFSEGLVVEGEDPHPGVLVVGQVAGLAGRGGVTGRGAHGEAGAGRAEGDVVVGRGDRL